jgi:glycosyltransferase involved in cell wall biosynthesis
MAGVADETVGADLGVSQVRDGVTAEDVPRVSVVMPTLNEAANIPYVLPRVPDWVHEVILVDGHSTDETVALARQIRPDITVITQTGRGKGDALQAGFRAVTGDIIVTLDADGSTDPAELPAFVGLLMAGADFVKGSRFMQGGGTDDMGLHRKAGNWALTKLVRLMFGCRFTDLCYGYNAFKYEVLPFLESDADGFEIETAMNVRALKANLKVAEVPSFEASRIHGVSNLRTYPDGWRVLRTILRERFRSNHVVIDLRDYEQRPIAPTPEARPPHVVSGD